MPHTRTPNPLRVCFWNANGILNKILELDDFIAQHEIDIILISETHLRPANNFKRPNFHTYRNDRLDGHGGGTAILIKSHITHSVLPTPILQTVEATSVRINIPLGSFVITSVYNPPRSLLTAQDLDLLVSHNVPVVVAGDLNAKHPAWNSLVTNRNGRALYNFMSARNDLTVAAPLEPTFYSTQGHRPDVLDVALLKALPFGYNIEVLNELDSDHNPVVLTIDAAPCEPPRPKCKTYWPLFKDRLKTQTPSINPIDSIDDLDDAVATITTTILEAITQSSSPLKSTPSTRFLPVEIRDKIREKHRQRKLWQNTGYPIYRQNYNRLTRVVKILLKNHRNDRWATTLEALDPQDPPFWNLAKVIRRDPKASHPIHSTNGLQFDPVDKAEAFADSLESQFTPNRDNVDFRFINEVSTTVRRELRAPTSIQIPPTDPGGVISIITSLANRKAPGPNSIPNLALKNLPQKTIMFLVNIINASLRL